MHTKAHVESLLAGVKEINTRLAKVEESNVIKSLAAGMFSPVGRDSIERKALAAFGCSHVAQLLHINTGLPKYANYPAEYKECVRQLKHAVDVARWTSQMFYGESKDMFGTANDQDRVSRVKGMLDHNWGRNELTPRLKAFGSTVSTGGDEWVPTLMSTQYVEEYELAKAVEGQFKEMTLGSAPYDLPVQKTTTTARKIAEGAAITDTNFQTNKITFSPVKLGEYYILPEELNEDSAPDIFAVAKAEVVEAQLRAVETAIINGDDDGTHLDSDTQAGAADLAEKAWKGLRRQAIANSANGGTVDFGNAAAAETNIRVMRAKMKRFGVHSNELMMLSGPAVSQQLAVLPSVKTLDVFGPNATVIKGSLSNYQGIPIVVSQFMREDLNASGVYDGTTTNRGGLLLVNLKRWYVGLRRPIRLKVMEDLPSYDRWLLASYQRKDFQGHAQSATEVSVTYGVNIAV